MHLIQFEDTGSADLFGVSQVGSFAKLYSDGHHGRPAEGPATQILALKRIVLVALSRCMTLQYLQVP